MAKARDRRAAAHELLADGTDPSAAKREEKLACADAVASTFEVVPREWAHRDGGQVPAITQLRVKTWRKKDVHLHRQTSDRRHPTAPRAGKGPVRKLYARGSAHRVKRLRWQVVRFGMLQRWADYLDELRSAAV